MKTFDIQTMQGVEQFLRYVIEPNGLALGMGFHPDNDFADYIKEDGEKADMIVREVYTAPIPAGFVSS